MPATGPGRDGDGAPLQGQIRQNIEDHFVNADALDAKQKRFLGILLSRIMDVSQENFLVPLLFVPNPLTKEQGTEAKFYDWSQLVAVRKPDGAPTHVQKIRAGVKRYELEEHEVKVGITDKAKINFDMTAQAMQQAGGFGRAFARAIDADGFNHMVDDMNTTAVGNWDTDSDDQVSDDISAALELVRDNQFNPNVIIMTERAKNRFRKIGFNFSNPLTAKQVLNDHFEIPIVHTWRDIFYKNEDGIKVQLFTPKANDHSLAVFDENALAAFSQRPTTAEPFRDAEAGADLAMVRKFFGSAIVQEEAGQLLTSIFGP